jgi:hypothetical protein
MADEAKYGEDVWGASLDALTLQLRALHELRKGFDPEYREGRHTGATADPQAGQMQKFLFGLAQLQLDHFRQVLEFSTKHFDYVVEQLRRAGRLGAPWTGLPPCLTVSIAAPIGGRVTETFTIHNFRGRPTAMRFSTTDFVRDGTGDRIAVPVTVEPLADTFDSVLEPHGAAEFRLSFAIDPARFTAPGRYQATTYVMDKDTVAGRVTIDLEVRARATRIRTRTRRRRRAK